MTLDAQRADFRIHLLLLDCLLVRISLKSDASCYFAYLYLSLILFLFLILLLLFSSISLYLYNFLFSLLIFFSLFIDWQTYDQKKAYIAGVCYSIEGIEMTQILRHRQFLIWNFLCLEIIICLPLWIGITSTDFSSKLLCFRTSVLALHPGVCTSLYS